MAAKGSIYITLYALVFLVFAIIWLRLFFKGAFPQRKIYYLSAISLGALAFILTEPIQRPLQRFLNTWASEQELSIWVLGLFLTLMTGLVQEALKLAAAWLSRLSGDAIPWMTSCLAVGIGFGVWEAWRVVALPLGMVAIWSPYAVIERFSVIGLHIALSAIIAYGIERRQPVRYFLLAALWHGGVNYIAILYQQWLLTLWQLEALIFVFSLAALAVGGWMYRRTKSFNHG